MASINGYPEKYLRFNSYLNKNPTLIVKIEGLDLLSNRVIKTTVRYGDGTKYGTPGIVYGGLRPVAGQQALLDLDSSSLTLDQTLEPEQGRGSVSTMNLVFLDKDGYMTRAISPGVIIPEILGRRVQVFLGYEQISYPEDFFVIFEGVITGTKNSPTKVMLQCSDPNAKRRGNIFYCATTILDDDIDDSQTTIPVVANGDFHKQILGPDGNYDPAIQTFMMIDEELIEYDTAGFGTNVFTGVTRGASSGQQQYQAAAHEAGADISSFVQIQDNCMDMALKLMLSGWNGPWITDVELLHIVFTASALGDVDNALVLPDGVDAVRDYNLTVGDYVTVSGASIGGNNKTAIITGFLDINGQSNRALLMDDTFTSEPDTAAVMAFRSQFDVYPTSCGCKLKPTQVDIAKHIYLRNTFLGQDLLRFFITAPVSGKTFIEEQIYLAVGAYSLTRFGKLSVGMTLPPIADERVTVVDADSVVSPETITVDRAINNRKFFNEVQWQYDYSDAGQPVQTTRTLDTDSLQAVQDISLVLPISSQGSRTDLGGQNRINSRSQYFLRRYGRGALLIALKLNWLKGNLIEAGDKIVVRDEGALKIPNLANGKRQIGFQMFEVIKRTLDIKNGLVPLTLLSGPPGSEQDRYATFAPSSLIASGSTTSSIKFQDSYGALYPGNEQLKWTDFVGQNILIHDYYWTFSQEVQLLGFDPADPYRMLVGPGLVSPPPAGYIIDLPPYPDTTDPQELELQKLLYCFWDPSVSIVTGISGTQFTVAPGDADKFQVGLPVLVHNASYSIESPECLVEDVTGVTVTLATSLGFTPSAGQLAELIGFKDGGQPYRFL